MNPGLQLQRNPELPAGWVAFPLASGIGSAYNPVRDSIAAPGTSLGQPSFPLALGFSTVVLGPLALQKAGCLPRDRYPARNQIQGSVSLPRKHNGHVCSLLQSYVSVQLTGTHHPTRAGLGPQATKRRVQGL